VGAGAIEFPLLSSNLDSVDPEFVVVVKANGIFVFGVVLYVVGLAVQETVTVVQVPPTMA
jgi:hypothetical protein